MANTSFSDLKKSRSSQIEKLNQELTKVITPQNGSSKDERFWEPTVDKAGNGYAVIRFLPAPKNEDVPFIQLWSHGFKGPSGLWYIENSLTTLKQADPVAEHNSMLWNSGKESDKEIARAQKRRLHFISNILVIKDPGNPENDGKIFLFKYGKKIFNKLNDIMNPQFDDEQPINPFDMWEGANFKLKIRQVEGYRNYDKSEFDSPSAISDSDKELEKIWNQQYSLQEFLSPSNFKSYDELKTKLDKVLGTPISKPVKDLDEEKMEMPKGKTKSSPVVSDEDDDDLEHILASLKDDD